MHLVLLRLVSTMLSIVFKLGSLLDIKKDLTVSAKSTIEAFVNSRTDFLQIETLSSNKTTN